jgi:hypothetical protein
MPHDHKSEILRGRLQRLLFSPKGAIEGLLLTIASKTVQVSLDPGNADAAALADSVGQSIEITATADRSAKTRKGAHPVFELDGITTLAGKAFAAGDAAPVSGVVADIHYARHGEPNGVILQSGEFIHTRPPGMKKLKLQVGSTVVAHGPVRTTVLGTALVEAREVNRMTLD